MEEQNVFSKKDVSRLLELNPATVAFYTREGIITPAVANPQGRGTTRLYSKLNLLEFLLVKKLSSFGFNLEKIEKIMDSTRRWGLGAQLGEGIDMPPDAKSLLEILQKVGPETREKMQFNQYLVVYETEEGVSSDINQSISGKSSSIDIDLELEGKNVDAVLIINIGELIKKVLNL
jgi:DNA-binding transcriptional MerR regulator